MEDVLQGGGWGRGGGEGVTQLYLHLISEDPVNIYGFLCLLWTFTEVGLVLVDDDTFEQTL